MTIDLQDPRTQRGLLIAAQAGQWARCHLADGSKAYGISSSKDPNTRYLVTQHSCSCPDFRRRGVACKHMQGVRLHCALVKALS